MPSSSRSESQEILVSCLTVTRQRVEQLARAVDCFRKQTVASRELVVVYDADDREGARYVDGLEDPQIRGVEVAKRPRLGWLRNVAVANAKGVFVAQWDDDDWSSPDRLQAQLSATRRSGKPACVLSRWTVFDAATRRAYLSYDRAWEGSLLARRDALPSYDGSLSRGEDTPVVNELVARDDLVLLKRPDLYVYVFHGKNTWTAHHFEDLLARSRALSDRKSRCVEAQLALTSRAERVDSTLRAAWPPA
jgi:glycosyltransferase involved in cell wall biosynthesis